MFAALKSLVTRTEAAQPYDVGQSTPLPDSIWCLAPATAKVNLREQGVRGWGENNYEAFAG